MKNLNNEIIVDVRTTEEWEFDGHAECSVNYPLDQFDDVIANRLDAVFMKIAVISETK